MEPDVFFGRLTPQRAVVYVRFDRSASLADASVSGDVNGPECALGNTLPGTSPLNDLGDGPTILAAATIVDPCFWSPKLPATYQVHWRLNRGGHGIALGTQQIGLRLLVPQGGSFYWEGKRSVFRAIHWSSLAAEDTNNLCQTMDLWRESRLSLIVEQPSEELCLLASSNGLPIFIDWLDSSELRPLVLRQLSRWPCVIGVMLDREEMIGDVRRISPNLLVGLRCGPGQENLGKTEPDFVYCDAEVVPQTNLTDITTNRISRIVSRPIKQPVSVVELRKQCDVLQASLAHLGSFAGYAV